jgi:hypothetical protein
MLLVLVQLSAAVEWILIANSEAHVKVFTTFPRDFRALVRTSGGITSTVIMRCGVDCEEIMIGSRGLVRPDHTSGAIHERFWRS